MTNTETGYEHVDYVQLGYDDNGYHSMNRATTTERTQRSPQQPEREEAGFSG